MSLEQHPQFSRSSLVTYNGFNFINYVYTGSALNASGEAKILPVFIVKKIYFIGTLHIAIKKELGYNTYREQGICRF